MFAFILINPPRLTAPLWSVFGNVGEGFSGKEGKSGSLLYQLSALPVWAFFFMFKPLQYESIVGSRWFSFASLYGYRSNFQFKWEKKDKSPSEDGETISEAALSLQ